VDLVDEATALEPNASASGVRLESKAWLAAAHRAEPSGGRRRGRRAGATGDGRGGARHPDRGGNDRRPAAVRTTMTNVNEWNAKIIEEFRSNGGQVGGGFEGAPVLLLHTTGARSGLERVNPMMYLDLDGHRYVFASKAGADTNPDWYHNLVANPQVTAEVGPETLEATAVPVTGEPRDRIYAEQARRYPGFAEYEAKTGRVIPVVELRNT
jgi:deazaflavin-dependent oxidoreductase (nitroreductase family)